MIQLIFMNQVSAAARMPRVILGKICKIQLDV